MLLQLPFLLDYLYYFFDYCPATDDVENKLCSLSHDRPSYAAPKRACLFMDSKKSEHVCDAQGRIMQNIGWVVVTAKFPWKWKKSASTMLGKY